jgi:hypothetical protein
MPFVRISLLDGKPADYHRAIADGVHSAMRKSSALAVFNPGPKFPLDDQQKALEVFVSSKPTQTLLDTKGTSQ